MGAGYLIAAVFNELVQAVNGGTLFVIGAEVKNLGYGAVFPGLNLREVVSSGMGRAMM